MKNEYIRPEPNFLSRSANAIDNDLQRFRHIGDPEADQLIGKMMADGNKNDLYKVFQSKSFPEINKGQIDHEELLNFVLRKNQLPVWADSKKMNMATALFRSNGNEFLFMLGIVSLPYCYAAAKGAISLYHTEKIRKNTELRLLDTTAFVVDIMGKNSFCECGDGFLAIKQVRLRHAMARYFLKKVPQIRMLGEVPINQEDMTGTNLAFSYIALRTLPKIGVKIPLDIQDAYIHFWSVIGYLMGIDPQLLPDKTKRAYQLEKVISRRQFSHSYEGKELTNHLISHYKEAIPNKGTTLLIKPLMRYLNGEHVAGITGISSRSQVFDLSYLMTFLPYFKKLIFPPAHSFEFIRKQLGSRRKELFRRAGN